MNQSKQGKTFWTAGRASLAALAFAATAFVISSCTSSDTANLSANQRAEQAANAGTKKPQVTVTAKTTVNPQQPQQPQAQAGALETVPAAVWNAEIPAVDGPSFRLSDFKDKIVVLNLWATWCGPCRQEIPHNVAMADEYRGKGVEFIGLTTEAQTEAEAVRDFAKEFKINYKLGWARGDVAQGLMQGHNSIPQTFVIAPGGRIITKFRGFSNRVPDMIRAAIDKANNEKTGD